ncbi:DP13B protein, partial [Polyodon spathula]|nr:DP13B protein [Polyodon spathula]
MYAGVLWQCVVMPAKSSLSPSLQFQLRDVVQFAAHQENRRLIGFVVQGPEISEEMEPSLSAYVFESNTEGEKICYTISLGKELIEAEKDPESLALLMKSMPLTSDGKFLVLESETVGAVQNGAEEGLESEA